MQARRPIITTAEREPIALLNINAGTYEIGSGRQDRGEIISYDSTIALHQPDYGSSPFELAELARARHEARTISPLTTFENIDRLKRRLEAISLSDHLKFNIAGQCDWEVGPDISIKDRVQQRLALNHVMEEETDEHTENAQRDENECNKPRNQAFELADGIHIPSYVGGMVNGRDRNDRKPTPSRMVAARLQARDVWRHLAIENGRHIWGAHEALNLAYEEDHAYLHRGKIYIASGDMVWVGDKTRSGKHLDLLEQIENAVALKIGQSVTADDLRFYINKLNPRDPMTGRRRPGKLTLMMRFDMNDDEKADELLNVIAKEAPETILMYDIHAAAKMQPDGTKTRLVTDIIDGIINLSAACRARSLRLHGWHLEAMGRDDIKECIDFPGDAPTRESFMDPNLNLSQLRRVIRETRSCF